MAREIAMGIARNDTLEADKMDSEVALMDAAREANEMEVGRDIFDAMSVGLEEEEEAEGGHETWGVLRPAALIDSLILSELFPLGKGSITYVDALELELGSVAEGARLGERD
jgi:hypothetical protein